MSEKIIRDVAAHDPYFKAGILRYFNVYGSDVKGRLGNECDWFLRVNLT